MDRTVARRRHAAFLLAVLLTSTLCPTADGWARLPNISDEPCGDPGDGVLRPADVTQAGLESLAASGTAPSRPAPATMVLIPCLSPTGFPWQLTFHLVRIQRLPACQTRQGRPESTGSPSRSLGRWHRAP